MGSRPSAEFTIADLEAATRLVINAAVCEAIELEAQDQDLAERHPPLWWLLERFHLALDALREMTQEVLPHIIEREQERLGPVAMTEMESLEPHQQEQLRHVLDAILEETRSGQPSNIQSDSIPDWAPALKEVFKDDDHSLVSFLERMRKATSGPDRAAIMHNSLLGQAIGAFEVLVSGVITRYFLAHPDALETGQKEFSLADIRTFTSVDDAADVLLSQHVSRVMYGGLDDWAEWFKKRCKVDLADLSLGWDAVYEAFQRRHVIMHNGGLASRQYLSKVKGPNRPEVGARLPVDAAYLHSALDELDVLGTLLTVMAWGSWSPQDRDRSAGALLQRSYDLMREGRWRAVEKLTSVGRKLECSAATHEPIRVNGWNSRLELYGLGNIRDEVIAWDVSVAVGRFRLVKLVLLGQLDRAAGLVPELLAAKELSRGQLKEWPILRTLREHDGFDASSV